MNKILLFLHENGIEGFFISDHLGERIEYELQGFKLQVKVKKSTTIEEFKKEVDEQYLVILKARAELYKMMSDSYFDDIENFKSIFDDIENFKSIL